MGQLFHFTKSLCAMEPFGATKGSISTLFDPIFSQETETCQGLDIIAVKLHGMVMRDYGDDKFKEWHDQYMFALSTSITADPVSRESLGYRLAVVNISSLLSYCSDTNPVARAFGVAHEQEKVEPFGFEASKASDKAFERALAINLVTIKTILRHEDVSPLLSYLHVWLAFLYSVSRFPPHEVPPRVLAVWPWETLSLVLGGVREACCPSDAESLPHEGPPLPEDYAMRGTVWVGRYLPEDWFAGDKRDQDERVIEGEWMREERTKRCAWLYTRVEAVKRSWEEKT